MSELTKHTPGPWKVRPYDLDSEINPARECESKGEKWQYQDWAIINPVTLRTVATVGWRLDRGGWGPTKNRAEAVANRNLIEAAPDLLTALEDLVNGIQTDSCALHCKGDYAIAQEFRVALKAIAKAKGGQ